MPSVTVTLPRSLQTVRARLQTCNEGTVVVTMAAVLFILIWRSVLNGDRTLVGGDSLYGVLPWAGSAGAHPARNGLMFDIIDSYVPWISLVDDSFRHGHMPLWNPYEFGGAPLLANMQSAPFSPFTLITIPFDPAHGVTIAMLCKLWVAGIGMGIYLRALRCKSLGCAAGGLIYATSASLNVWLGDTIASVLALMPWAFAAMEWYCSTGRRQALAAVAVAVALQFLAGFPETSAYLCCALTLYACLTLCPRGRAAIGPLLALSVAGLCGAALAAVQLVPFGEFFTRSGSVALRHGVGLQHLSPNELTSWVVPNMFGNPAIDHLNFGGRPPNYNESTGFVGVGALMLAAVSVFARSRPKKAQSFALAAIVTAAGATVYGAITPLVGRLPLFEGAKNERMLGLMCFGLSALAGLGADALEARDRFPSPAPRAFLAAGTAALGALVVMALIFVRIGSGVDALFPHGPRDSIGFWLVVAGCSFAAGWCFLLSGLAGGGRSAARGFAALALTEGALFAGPYNPRVPVGDVPPPSAAMNWLQRHADGFSIAAIGRILSPESPTLFGLHDVRGYETLIDPRVFTYWSHADSGFRNDPTVVFLSHPRVTWLAAAGVRYVMTRGGVELRGTTVRYRGEGVAIAEVPRARPFAYAASHVVTATTSDRAAARLAHNPLGATVIESRRCSRPSDASAHIRVLRRDAGAVELDVAAHGPATVVVLQSYAPGWTAETAGHPLAIRPADVLFQAVTVPSGHHVISLRYAPQSIRAGAVISLLGVLGVLVLALTGERWRKDRSLRDPDQESGHV